MTDADKRPPDLCVPEDVFTDLVGRIDDLAELKLLLHVVHTVARRGREFVPESDLFISPVLKSIEGVGSPEPAEDRLRRTIQRAVANGTLIRLVERAADETAVFLMPSTRRSAEIVDALRAGGRHLAESPESHSDSHVTMERPNVFGLYEQYIGPLTPLIAENLRDAERTYPRHWIEEAIFSAVHYNKRTWQYIRAILLDWEDNGPPRSTSRRGV